MSAAPLGWLAVDVITFVSRCSIPGLPLTRPETLTEARAQAMLQLATSFVSEHGGLLAGVSAAVLRQGERFEQRKAWLRFLAQVRKL